jgi:hypothetical protein
MPRRTFLKLAGAAGGTVVVATAIKKPDLLAFYETTETKAAFQAEGGRMARHHLPGLHILVLNAGLCG